MALDFSWNDGERVMFLGDTVSEEPLSFTQIVPAMVTARYPELAIEYLPRVVGGNRIGDLLMRLDRDVFGNGPKPSWVIVSIGVNDVFHGATGTPLGRFEQLYDELLLRLRDTNATLMCLTTTVIGEELENEQNQALIGYNDAIRRIAFGHGAQVVDINTAFRDAITRAQAKNPDFRYTVDNVHLNSHGSYLMAATVLGALNFSMT